MFEVIGVFTNSPKQLIELIGLFFIFISLLIGLSLWTFDISDPTLNHSVSASIEVKNAAGTFGAYLSGFLVDIFGLLSYIWVLFFFMVGIVCITRKFIPPWYSMIGYIILFICFIIAAEAFTFGFGDAEGGGVLGAWLYALLHEYFNPVGSAFIWFFALMVGFELCFHISWVMIFSHIVASSQKVVQKKSKDMTGNFSKKFLFSRGKKVLADESNTIDIDVKSSKTLSKADKKADFLESETGKITDKNSKSKELKLTEKDPLGLSSRALSFEHDAKDEDNEDNASMKKEGKLFFKDRNNSLLDEESSDKNNQKKEEKKKSFWRSVFFSDETEEVEEEQKNLFCNLPPIDLLSPVPEQNNMPTRESLEAKGDSLIQCLLDFSVQGTLAGILPGPVVTMFEVRPERGVKAKRFEVLAKEIAMAIKAIAVRVQAPIPGTDTVGIEIPNDTRQLVSFREIIQSDAFSKSDSVLSLGLAKDIFGKPVCAKLEEMPHLLVAGATGAGKSVCLNSIILSILYKARPHEVKMLLIDPKRVELAMYADLPHLVHPVVTDMDLAKNALLWAIDEMDQRYQLFQNTRVRNFNEYNALIKKQQKKREEECAVKLDCNSEKEEFGESGVSRELRMSSGEGALQTSEECENLPKPLPYIVIIVDELADLMMQKGRDVEASIVRLAQLARAAGIHLIIATQRPSVDVVTGLIKANFPSRIAFQVTSGIDSRTILDTVGAEALLGKGDMLFKPRAGALQRMHGAYVTDEEVTQVVEFWTKGRKAEYTVDFTQYGPQATEHAFGDKDDSYDPMFDTILERIIDMDEISISMLQRHFKLGFGRAGRIMDQLERDGIVGPASGSKPRKVMKTGL